MKNHPLDTFRYCPVCGSRRFVPSSERSSQCSDCGFEFFANSSAAVVAFIFNPQGELLVVRRGRQPARGTLDLPGGFVDLNETLEHAVMREVMEETGLQVVESRYLFSVPNTYEYSHFIVHTTDAFFRCEVADMSVLKASDDAAEAKFLPLQSITPDEFGLFSISQGVKKFLENPVEP